VSERAEALQRQRAEAYVRRLAEAELRRAAQQARAFDAGVEAGGQPDPGPLVDGTLTKVVRAGWILIAAGALDQEFFDHLTADFAAAVRVRSRVLQDWERSRRRRPAMFLPPGRPPLPEPPAPACPALSVTPIGRSLPVPSERAPAALHFLSLVRTPAQALLTVTMHMYWPPDGSSTDLEITGAGPHHLPYGELAAADERGSRYTVRFDHGAGGTAAWHGLAELTPVPPPAARRLDLIADGVTLIELPTQDAPPGPPPVAEPVANSAAERLLVWQAERILAGGDPRGPTGAGRAGPEEIITVLTDAGMVEPGNTAAAQLAALCQRFGGPRPGRLTPGTPSGPAAPNAPPAPPVPAPAALPAEWASVLAHRDAAAPAGRPEVFAPVAVTLPDLDGTQLVLAGLSVTAGQSHLHVISGGLPLRTARYTDRWLPGFSWWLRDPAGRWHLGTAAEPDTVGDGLQAFRLQWTPPLPAAPGPAEIVVTGPGTRVRATLAIPARPSPADPVRPGTGGG
jgi:hypothetical protein